MTSRRLLVCLIAAVVAGGAVPARSAQQPADHAIAQLRNEAGEEVGTVQFGRRDDRVLVTASVTGLGAGFHGFHVHDVGKCQPTFADAGGHYNPGGDAHRNHAGDMPVLFVEQDGTATAQFFTDRFTVEQLLNDDVAVIIHARPDNYANIPAETVVVDGTVTQRAYYYDGDDARGGIQAQPGPAPDTTLKTGDAGARAACGVVAASDEAPPPLTAVPDPDAVAEMEGPGGHLGEVRLFDTGDGTQVIADLQGLSAGFHGFHVHDVGACEPDFSAAGGHYNPGTTNHGDHAGDMPVVLAPQTGGAFSTFTTDRFTVEELVAADVAIIVHAQPDNYANIPAADVQAPDGAFTQRAYYYDSDLNEEGLQLVDGPAPDTTLKTGDAGARVACGVVTAVEEPPELTRGPCSGFRPGTRTRVEGGSVIVGTLEDDVLLGTSGDDIICGLGGNDQIDARGGRDLVVGNRGNDQIDGGGGKDTLRGGAGRDAVDGRAKNDILRGGAGKDTLRGNRGWDTIRGGGRDDVLQGGVGNDILRGGRGDDTLKGFTGDDVLNGGPGDDSCRPGRGSDITKNCEG